MVHSYHLDGESHLLCKESVHSFFHQIKIVICLLGIVGTCHHHQPCRPCHSYQLHIWIYLEGEYPISMLGIVHPLARSPDLGQGMKPQRSIYRGQSDTCRRLCRYRPSGALRNLCKYQRHIFHNRLGQLQGEACCSRRRVGTGHWIQQSTWSCRCQARRLVHHVGFWYIYHIRHTDRQM